MSINFHSIVQRSLFVALTSATLFAGGLMAQGNSQGNSNSHGNNGNSQGNNSNSQGNGYGNSNNAGNAPMEVSAAVFLGVLGAAALLKKRANRP